jgi:filamentous hemagglutinin
MAVAESASSCSKSPSATSTARRRTLRCSQFAKSDGFTPLNRPLAQSVRARTAPAFIAHTTERLGDGFYEQKLIREQVAQLTGQRFLGNYSSDEAQYRALMNSAATQVGSLQLRPGIALSEAQMAALTSDIVWLVEREVMLADGTRTRALVPQVYVRTRAGDVDGTGALLAGRNVKLDMTGDVVTSGTVAGRNVTLISANNVRNLTGIIAGAQVGIMAKQDIDNIGGSVVATNLLKLNAGRDINVTTTTVSSDPGAAAAPATLELAATHVRHKPLPA